MDVRNLSGKTVLVKGSPAQPIRGSDFPRSLDLLLFEAIPAGSDGGAQPQDGRAYATRGGSRVKGSMERRARNERL